MILVSPTEPAALRSIGESFTLTPEYFGADVLILEFYGRAAIQRKTLADLYASIRDGRIDKQINQLRSNSPDYEPILIIESAEWTSSFSALHISDFPYSAYLHFTHTIARSGILLISTTSLAHTIATVQSLATYYTKPTHNTFSALQTHVISPGSILQYVPGIGPKLAHAIVNHFGSVPLAWTISRSELLEVPGIGPKLADKILSCFQPS